MIARTLAILLLVVVVTRVADGTPAADLQRLDWLVGTWERIDLPEGRSGSETWRALDAGAGYAGQGESARADGSRFVEQLRIVVHDSAIHYVAEVPGNPEPVYFRLVSIGDDGFVVENPDHDFPQRIAYKRDGDLLSARISAGDEAMTFRFRRQH